MSENVFNIIGLGRQSGDFDAPGAAVPATFLFPVEDAVAFDLDRGSAYPKQDRGRNVRNNRGSGYNGVRGAGVTLPFGVRYEDLPDILEMHFGGNVSPVSLGGGLYRYDYVLETGAPTVVPYTIEGGNTDDANAQERLLSALVAQLTLGFPNITAPGAAPWTGSAEIVAFDREISELTDPLAARDGLQVALGHRTQLFEGDTSEAFSALAELAHSLKMYTQTTNRSTILRAHGGTDDLADKFGFSDQSNGTFEMAVAISETAKTDFHDAWNAASPVALGEKRIRLLESGP
jgi:hypothetical protein